MRLSQLTPDRLRIAREEYGKLVTPIVTKLLGGYGAFEWVLYRAEYPFDFWKKDLSEETVRTKLSQAIFRALKDMLCEAFVKYYGPTTGPTESSRLVQRASLEAYIILRHPDEADADRAAYEIDGCLRKATSCLTESGLDRVADKLRFFGDPDSLVPALDELYPSPLDCDFDETKAVDIEDEIDTGCLAYYRTKDDVKKITWRDKWNEVPESPAGYLLASDSETDEFRLAPVRPDTPLATEFDSLFRLGGWMKDSYEEKRETSAPEPQDEYDVLSTLRNAIGSGFLVKIRYQDRNGEETVRLVRPDSLEEKDFAWYLKGYCTLRKERRTFLVPRILEAVPTDTPAPAPKDDEPAKLEQKPAQTEKTPVEVPKKTGAPIMPEPQNREPRPASQVRPLRNKDEREEQELDGHYDRGEEHNGKTLRGWFGLFGFIVMTAAFYALKTTSVFSEYELLATRTFVLLQILWIAVFAFTSKK